MNQVSITILFFAKSRELVKKEKDQLLVHSPISYSELKQLILKSYPELTPIQDSFFLALNQGYISEEQVLLQLNSADSIAVIPPISGG